MDVLQRQNDWSPCPNTILSHDFCFITSQTKEIVDCPAAKRQCKGFHRRIPCRARSLSNNHNSDTAYFEIPFDAPHGLQLHCSHKECIQSGRRFRYCLVCKIPVAKRNFVKRHGHGMIHSARQLRDTIDRFNPCSGIVDADREPDTDDSTSIPTLSSQTEPSQGLNDISSSENEQDAEDLESLALETLSDSGNKNIITSTTTSIHQLKQNKSDAVKKSFACIDIHPMSNQTVEIPTYNPVPNPLTILSQGIPQVIPTSPKVKHCPLDISMIPESHEIPYFDFKSVLFDKPESQITEVEFPLDIDEIDFATIFD